MSGLGAKRLVLCGRIEGNHLKLHKNYMSKAVREEESKNCDSKEVLL